MPATTDGRRPGATNRGGYNRKRRTRRQSPASQGHPSQGRPTVGGGTKSKPVVYHSPTPSPPASQGHPSQGRPTVGGGTKSRPKAYRSPTPSVRQQRRKRKSEANQRKARRALLRYATESVGKVGEPLRDRDWKPFGINVEAELEGRGVLPKAGKWIGKTLGEHSGAALRAGGLPISDKQAENAVKDASDLAANFPSGAYMTAAAIKEAALNGDTKRLDQLWKDYKKSSAASAVTSGDFKEAYKRAQERPISTALELSGGKALVGRGAGGVMRAGALGKRAKRAASTERADLKLYPDDLPTIGKGPRERRSYSKDAITKGAQVAVERHKRKHGQDPDVDAGDANFGGMRVARPTKRQRRALGQSPGRRSRLMRSIDTDVFSAERVRRARIEEAVRETSTQAPHPRKSRYPKAKRHGNVKRSESPAVRLVSEGTVLTRKTFRADLEKRLAHLINKQQEATERGGHFARGNKHEIGELRKLLDLDESALDRVFASVYEVGAAQAKRRARTQGAGMRSSAEDFARFKTVAQSHMGAKHDTRPRHTEAYDKFIELRESERHAASAARMARQRLETLRRHEAKAEGVAKMQASTGRRVVGKNSKTYYHGTDKATAEAIVREGSFNGRRRGTVWAGDRETAKQYGDTVLEVKVNARRPLDVDSERYVEVTHGKQTASAIEQAVKDAGYDAIVSKRHGWIKSFDRQRVQVHHNGPRTDLTKRQGERLLKVQAARAEAEAAHAKALEAARAATQARKDAHVSRAERRKQGLRLPSGKLVTKADVEAFLRSKGRDPETIGFFSESPVKLSSRGAASESYLPPTRGSGATGPVRTGRRKGSKYDLGRDDIGAESITRQAVLQEGEATTGEIFQTAIGQEYGIPAGRGGTNYAATYKEALARGQELTEVDGALKPGHRRLLPFNIDGLSSYGERLRTIQDNIARDGGSARNAESEALTDALGESLSAESGRGRWILLPEDVVERLRAHANVRTGPAAGLTGLFKDVVLTTSSPSGWLLGNASDLSFRTIMEGITPSDILRGAKIIRGAETKGIQGEMAAAATAGGGFFHSAAMGERFAPLSANEAFARTVAAAPWRAWKGSVYAVEHWLEELPQYGRIGKAARRGELGDKVSRLPRRDEGMRQSIRRLLVLTDDQVDVFAARLSTDKALERRIQGAVEDVIGRWGKVSPSMRNFLNAAPFIQWLGAALRYTYVTLPVKHPIKAGLIAGLMEMTEEERGKLGLSYIIPDDMRAQDYQMGTLPFNVKMGKYGLEVSGPRTSNLTSFGTAGQFPLNLPGFILPQLRGAFGALGYGAAFSGEKMVYPDWWPDKRLRGIPLSSEDRTKVAIGSLLESGVPFASAFRRAIQEEGRSSMPFSTVIDPQTRKKWDKEHKQWRESEGSMFGGIMEWLNPVSSSKIYTHGSIRDIQESQEAGRVFGRARDKGDAQIRREGGQSAVRVNQKLRDIRAAKQRIIAKHPGVDSDNPTPEYERLHIAERRLNEQLYRLTHGKHGYRYKTPYEPSGGGGGGGGGGYFDDVKGSSYADEARQWLDKQPSSGGGYFDDVKGDDSGGGGYFDDVK